MAVQKPAVITTRNGEREVGRGSIVNVASCFSYVASRGMLPYVAAKHAVMGITKTAGKAHLTKILFY
jgi:NAD(P)-dependent dehydrogenase (short-subunit alcohol dehydrogenase family)